jgi:hypothetical protein
MVTQPNGLRAHSLPPNLRAQRAQEIGNPADMSWRCETPCLTIASVTASSTSGKPNGARNTLDRDLRTRWSPAGSAEQWLTYDLGAVREVASVSIAWFSSQRQIVPFSVMLSLDGKEYHVADNGAIEGRGSDESLRTFVAQNTRFVRIVFSLKPGDTLPGVQEVAIHGTATDAKETVLR